MVIDPSLKVCDHRYKIPNRRASFPSFYGSCKIKASMAVEGSLVLPLFLFFMMTVLFILEAVRFQSDMAQALHQVGSQAAVQEYLGRTKGNQRLLAEAEIKEYLRKQSLPYLCVKGKEKGVCIRDSSVKQSGIIEIHSEYQLASLIWWLPVGETALRDQFVGHAWTGYSGLEGGRKECEPDLYVYITQTGSKYHISPECSYLQIKVRAVDASWLLTGRNQWGSRYYPCEKCHAKENGIVYVTSDGNRYHSNGACSSLKRTVYLIPLREAEGYSCCGRCGR